MVLCHLVSVRTKNVRRIRRPFVKTRRGLYSKFEGVFRKSQEVKVTEVDGWRPRRFESGEGPVRPCVYYGTGGKKVETL